MIKSRTSVILSIDDEIKDHINTFHENVNKTLFKVTEIEKEIKEKIGEINEMIYEYNSDCQFIESSLEEVNELLGDHISNFSNAIKELESSLSEQSYANLDCWVSEWEDFNSTLKDLDLIRKIDEVDEDIISYHTKNSMNEIERHICYSQPSHSINIDDEEQEAA